MELRVPVDADPDVKDGIPSVDPLAGTVLFPEVVDSSLGGGGGGGGSGG